MLCQSLLLALIVFHDVSVAVTSNAGGASAVVQAYARPPAYVHRSQTRTSGECKCSNRKQSYNNLLACQLRCGGAKNQSAATQLSRRVTSLWMSKSNDGAELNNSAKYHLVWSPNFWKKMAISTTLWAILRYLFVKNSISFGLEKILFSHDMHACHGEPAAAAANGILRVLQTSIVLPLLSSSCCAIQLIINAISGWGCAGFNTYLGPIRPILLPILLFSTWKLLPQRSLGWTIISLFLAFLPELVDIWNTNRSQQWQQKHDNSNEQSISNSSSFPITAKLRLDIPTMGCVACVNKVDTSIRQCKSAANIRGEKSWLTDSSAKGGLAELSILANTNEEVDAIAEEVVTAVKDAGFQCDVESLQVEN
mmetsp:Transcript_24060/g.51021  ORF Transcript_24060/g.51021 Transcript_24060/m.51021 type:complete len:366 (+) Transcript_24060:109-1206(+)